MTAGQSVPFCTARPPGFFVGANLPWIGHGCDFGANAWHPDGGVARPVQRQLLRVTGCGVEGMGLDFYQVHWYDALERDAPLETLVREFGVDRPVLLGEFPTRGSARSPSEILGIAASLRPSKAAKSAPCATRHVSS